MQEALIVATITEALDTIADLKAKIEAYERVAELEEIRTYGAPTKYIAYSKSKQITSIEEVLEIAKQKLGRGEG
mgnify:FL=1